MDKKSTYEPIRPFKSTITNKQAILLMIEWERRNLDPISSEYIDFKDAYEIFKYHCLYNNSYEFNYAVRIENLRKALRSKKPHLLYYYMGDIRKSFRWTDTPEGDYYWSEFIKRTIKISKQHEKI
jgi:hypothetical protein